jgi:hypothetical protein
VTRAIEVTVLPPTEQGRLYPRYDVEAQILEVSSRVPRSWPFGIDVDGCVIFDIDSDFRLANFDLLIPKQRWRIDPTIAWQLPTTAGDLQISRTSIRHKSFHLPLRVLTNPDRTVVAIRFSDTTYSPVEIALSDQCTAQLTGRYLDGFVVAL